MNIMRTSKRSFRPNVNGLEHRNLLSGGYGAPPVAQLPVGNVAPYFTVDSVRANFQLLNNESSVTFLANVGNVGDSSGAFTYKWQISAMNPRLGNPVLYSSPMIEMPALDPGTSTAIGGSTPIGQIMPGTYSVMVQVYDPNVPSGPESVAYGQFTVPNGYVGMNDGGSVLPSGYIPPQIPTAYA